MKFTGTLSKPHLDLTAYRKVLDKHLREALAQALMEWLEATVLAMPEGLPVWSGATRATFLALARHIEYDIPIAPMAPSREAQGESQSLGLYDPGEKTPWHYTFTYVTTLPWLLVNEYFDARQWGFPLKHPGPYEFQAKGQVAFRRLAESVHLPDPFEFVQSRKIKVQ
jgi:hypothetical protein